MINLLNFPERFQLPWDVPTGLGKVSSLNVFPSIWVIEFHSDSISAAFHRLSLDLLGFISQTIGLYSLSM